MKTRLLMAAILVFMAFNTNAKETRFFVIGRYVGPGDHRKIEGTIPVFTTSFDNELAKYYPCRLVNSEDVVAAMIGFERMRALLGSGSDETLSNIAGSLGCEYVVVVEIGILVGDIFSVNAKIIPSKTYFSIISAVEYHPYEEKSSKEVDTIDKVAKKLVDGMKNMEICPFKGPVNVKITSSYKSNQAPEQYSVYCNGMDGTYKKTTTIEKYSDSDWAIQREGINSATGSFKYSLFDEQTIEEQNFCYECSPTKQGVRTYSEKITTSANVQGLSNESESNGIKVDDARVIITFQDNGTYTLRVKAASKKGIKKRIKVVHAEGVCNNIQSKPDTLRTPVDEGINEIFGPFAGSDRDKVLSQKNTIQRTNPITGEEETITYEFNLKKD
jgi:hypothetical protein